jgi:hypothetical protein
MLIALAAATIGSVAASACNDLNPFDPCPETKEQEKAGQLDGTWDLDFVQDVSGSHDLPYQPIPFISPTLTEGSLLFQTTSATKGDSCKDLLTTEGIVIADYAYKIGSQKKDSANWYSGRFVFDHTTRTLTLRAGKYTRSAEVKTNSAGERGIVASVNAGELKKDYDFLGTITMVFIRRPF